MNLRRWQKNNKNMPCPHYVPGSVLGARNTAVNGMDTGARRSSPQSSGEWPGPDNSLPFYQLLRIPITLRIKFKLLGPSPSALLTPPALSATPTTTPH